MAWLPVLNERATWSEVKTWDFYELLDCIEAMDVFADCNNLLLRPPPPIGISKKISSKGRDSVGLTIR